jgi:hypothetical protein
MPMAPPIGGALGPGSATAGLAAPQSSPATPGAGADAERQELEAVAAQVRQILSITTSLATTYPSIAPDVEQVRTILARALVKLAQAAPEQTASGMAVPMGGGGV